MKKIILLSAVLLLTACATPVPVQAPRVLDFPASLLTDCEQGEFLDPKKQLSENLKTMIDNNTKWAECRLSKKILIDSIKIRQEITDKTGGQQKK
jgi:hypothetical protein